VAGRRDYADLTPPEDGHYVLRDYVTPFGTALAAADLAVARAGGSIFELAQYGLPSVLIPYPHAAGDHQTSNARWMEQAGAATVIRDEALTARSLREAVDAIALDDARRVRMAEAARSIARPDAAGVIAREVLAAAATRR
jgi:UDP-N-acetylglucosamine--N-acetylmuramyl-(pentapeptide) pyrophosphoryl-undecaprenol N-acetylglucosamine transferase